MVVIVIFVCALLLTCALAWRRRGDPDKDWEIDYDELTVGPQLGVGGYGEVYRALWKGTEVAVKVMPADRITRDMEKSFKEEVHPPNRARGHITRALTRSTLSVFRCV